VRRTDFAVVLRDSVTLDAVKFVPDATPPPDGWPTVTMVHGYGEHKELLAGYCEDQASYGYYVATFSVRGQGISDGLSSLISTTEAQDLIEFVDWVKNDTASHPNPGKILITGGSQGGLLPLMAASRFGLNVTTLISALCPPNFASSWIENGCIKMTLLWTVSYTSDIARYDTSIDRIRQWIYNDTKAGWDSLTAVLPAGRDFDSFVPNNTIPLIVEGSWQDKFFNASGIIGSTAKLSVPFRMYVGSVMGHGGDTSASENQWHMNFYNDWILYWLAGDSNHVLDLPKYEFASTTTPMDGTMWSFEHASSDVWPIPTITPWRLYFRPAGALDSVPPSAHGETVTLHNRVDSNLTMLDAVANEFTGPDFDSMFVKHEIVFQTEPLAADYKLLGTPRIGLRYRSTGSPFCQYNFQLYEVLPDTTALFVNRLNFTDRDYTAGTERNIVFDGQAHSHIFRAGSRIRIVLTNLDTAPGDTSLLETNPFVLPVLINGDNDVVLGSESYLELPIVDLPMTLVEGRGGEVPGEFVLEQNFPNPFNPSTVFRFRIPVSSHVALKVYDVLGREVATLIDGRQQAGEKEVSWNAGGMPSGVYFYRLRVAGRNGIPSFSETRKLILLR
jgi:predicted acyl esterase